MSRLLGLDLGRRRIGVAVSDPTGRSARPLTTLPRGSLPEEDAALIARLAAEQRVDGLVVGLPLRMDGSTGPQAEETVAWSGRLAELTGLPVSLRDERFTSERASVRLGRPARGPAGGPPGVERRRAHRARIDREAATLILQAELDARSARS